MTQGKRGKNNKRHKGTFKKRTKLMNNNNAELKSKKVKG